MKEKIILLSTAAILAGCGGGGGSGTLSPAYLDGNGVVKPAPVINDGAVGGSGSVGGGGSVGGSSGGGNAVGGGVIGGNAAGGSSGGSNSPVGGSAVGGSSAVGGGVIGGNAAGSSSGGSSSPVGGGGAVGGGAIGGGSLGGSGGSSSSTGSGSGSVGGGSVGGSSSGGDSSSSTGGGNAVDGSSIGGSGFGGSAGGAVGGGSGSTGGGGDSSGSAGSSGSSVGGGNNNSSNTNPTSPNHTPVAPNPTPMPTPAPNESDISSETNSIFPKVVVSSDPIKPKTLLKDSFDLSKLYPLSQVIYKRARYDSRGVSSIYYQSNPSTYSTSAGFGFSKNWNQGFNGKDIILAVIDTGTSDMKNVVKNEHYEYLNGGIDYYWRPVENRLDESNFIKKEFEHSCIMINGSCKDEGDGIHGENVMKVANIVASGLKFANIVNGELGYSAKGYLEAPTIDALSNQGIRFFNRSTALSSNVNSTIKSPGNFAIAILKNNALFINAAGNGDYSNDKADTTGEFTNNALPENSPLRKGWIIAVGYLADFKKLGEPDKAYYVKDIAGNVHYLNHAGDTCKKYGWYDCIAGPYRIDNHPGTSFTTPLVASVAALVYEKYPWMSNENIKDTLFSTVYKVEADKDVLKAHYASEFNGLSKEQEDQLVDTKIKEHFGVGVLDPVKAMNGPARFDKDFLADVDTDNLYIFDNNISGDKGLIKQGIGTLALFGDNSFKGDIKNLQGQLWLVDYRLDPFIGAANNSPSVYPRLINNDILRVSSADANALTISSLENNGVLINEGLKVGELKLGANSVIISTLGESLKVFNSATLNGEFKIAGLKNAADVAAGKQNYTILESAKAGVISGQFKSVSSSTPLITLSDPSYSPNGVQISATFTDPSKLTNIDAQAQNNFKELFASMQSRLDYEHAKHDKLITAELASIYNKEGLAGGLDASEMRLITASDRILNTPASELPALSNRLFAGDFYDYSLANLARIKRILNTPLSADFVISQRFAKSKINSLNENIYQTTISGGTDSLQAGFNFESASSDALKSTTYAASLQASAELGDFRLADTLAAAYIRNRSNRLANRAEFSSLALANTLKISYQLGQFAPFISASAVGLHQRQASEIGDEFAARIDGFKKGFLFANVGASYHLAAGSWQLAASIDGEYRFNDFALSGVNKAFNSPFKTSKNSAKWLVNSQIGLNYRLKSMLELNLNYARTDGSQHHENLISAGFSYRF